MVSPHILPKIAIPLALYFFFPTLKSDIPASYFSKQQETEPETLAALYTHTAIYNSSLDLQTATANEVCLRSRSPSLPLAVMLLPGGK